MGLFGKKEEKVQPKFEYYLGKGSEEIGGERLIIRFGCQDVIIRACEGFIIDYTFPSELYCMNSVIRYRIFDSDLCNHYRLNDEESILRGEASIFSFLDYDGNEEIKRAIEKEAIEKGAKVLMKRRIS